MYNFQRYAENGVIMKILNQKNILKRALGILQNTLGIPEALLFQIKPLPRVYGNRRADAVFIIEIRKGLKRIWNKLRKTEKSFAYKLKGVFFVAEVRLSVQPRFLRNSIASLKALQKKLPRLNPMIITEYMGPESRLLCRQEGISYIDMVGNVGIFIEKALIINEGGSSKIKDTRRVKSLFSPKSTRIMRTILQYYPMDWRTQYLAEKAQVSLGQVSNVLKKLVDDEYMTKTKKGFRLLRPTELLNRWASIYVFTEANKIVSYYLSVKSQMKAMEQINDTANRYKIKYAFTLFAASAIWIPFVRNPSVHLYISDDSEKLVNSLNLKAVPTGGNISLVTPYDIGVFNPIEKRKKNFTVGMIQLYLDLVNYPTRGKEQAKLIRDTILGF
jgi:hypothetical protein